METVRVLTRQAIVDSTGIVLGLPGGLPVHGHLVRVQVFREPLLFGSDSVTATAIGADGDRRVFTAEFMRAGLMPARRPLRLEISSKVPVQVDSVLWSTGDFLPPI